MQAKSTCQILVPGNRANWLSIDSHRHLLRGDDGTLLKRRGIKNGDWRPVPVAAQSAAGNLSILAVPDDIAIVAGESKEVRITITNSGSHPAYWLRLAPSTSGDDVIRLDPPDQLVNGQGEQAWKPARIARLEPGKTATLYANIRLNLKLPPAFVQSGSHRLVLTVVSANHVKVSQPIKVAVRSPNLE